MSVYGYPREPEEPGDHALLPPQRVTSRDASVDLPVSPSRWSALVEPGPIPSHRPPAVAEPSSGEHRAVGALSTPSGRHRSVDPDHTDRDSGFSWLRPASQRAATTQPASPPIMGQPAVTTGRLQAAGPPGGGPDRLAHTDTGAPALTPEAEQTLSALVDGPEIAPWDRRPLLIVIASALVLAIIGVVAALVTIALYGPGDQTASWRSAPRTASVIGGEQPLLGGGLEGGNNPLCGTDTTGVGAACPADGAGTRADPP